MKHLLKICFYFGLASTFSLGSTNMNLSQLNMSSADANTELFSSADDDSKKNRKKKKAKKKKKKKKKLKARTING